MKKRNNKVIVLIVVAVLFAVSLLIFILNYSKDNSSFSILEKKWINDNTSNVLDISVYNDVPVYGKSGKGVIFDLLDDFTTTYGINFNKISYSVDSSSNLNKNAFRVLNNNESLTNKDILLYEDNYVLVSTEEEVINNINDIDNHTVAVLKTDLNTVSNDLSEVKKISYLQKENVNELEETLTNRRKGIATELMNKMIQEENYSRIMLEVNENNDSAIRLYNKLGFKEISLRDRYYGEDTAIIMEKVK